MQEFAARRAAAPDGHGGGARQLGLMRLAHHGGDDVRGLQIEVVARAVQIGGHGRNVVMAIFLAIGLAQLDPGDLGDGVPFVGRLQGAGQQRVLGDRLGRKLGIDAGRAQEQKLFHAAQVRGLDDGGLDRQIVEQELRRIGVIGDDAADFGGGQQHGMRLVGFDPGGDRAGIAQIHRVAVNRQDGAIFLFQLANQTGPDHAAMAGNPDALAGKRITHELRLPSSATFLRSEATISFTSCGKVISCFQPSTLRALLGSPSSSSTSVGRK